MIYIMRYAALFLVNFCIKKGIPVMRSYGTARGKTMKSRLKRTMSLFLLTVLLFTIAPGSPHAAMAEDWIEGSDVIEEPAYEAVDSVIFGEEIVYEEADVEELIDENQNSIEETLPVNIETEQDSQLIIDGQTPDGELVILEDAGVTEIIDSNENETTAADNTADESEASQNGTETSAEDGDKSETSAVQSFTFSEVAAFDAAAETGVSIYGRLNAEGNLDFCIKLPENAGEAAYTVIADDGQGGTESFVNKAGETDITVFSNVMPHQLSASMKVSVLYQGKTLQCSICDYLRQVPQQYADLDMSKLVPGNKAQYSGELVGVYNYCAKLDLSNDDTAILIYFRAENVEDLRFSCSGHNVTSPEQTGFFMWGVRLTGISVKDLAEEFSIVAEKGGRKVELRYSPFCDAAAHWDEDTPFVLLCRALTAAMADSEKNSAAEAQT